MIWILLTLALAAPTAGTDADGDGITVAAGDCDDTDPTVHPGAPELCDGKDNQCAGVLSPVERDDDGDGARQCWGDQPSDDCDDTDPAVFPGAEEIANGIDDDCDHRIDEDTPWGDDDRDGWSERDGDCDDTDPAVHPAADDDPGQPEVDDDCDGTVDDPPPPPPCDSGCPPTEPDVGCAGDGSAALLFPFFLFFFRSREVS